jgi:hypothetical protein
MVKSKSHRGLSDPAATLVDGPIGVREITVVSLQTGYMGGFVAAFSALIGSGIIGCLEWNIGTIDVVLL